jgi:hypothetical protein
MPKLRATTLAACVLLGAVSSTPTSAAPAGYTITDLGTLPGGEAAGVQVRAMNAMGEVVGRADVYPFIYTNGQMHQLEGGPGVATGINSSGLMVGYLNGSGGVAPPGFTWDYSLVATHMPAPGNNSLPAGVNGNGWVICGTTDCSHRSVGSAAARGTWP